MIDYKIIADSVQFYETKGFSRVEVPWTVTKQVSNITKPQGALDFELKHKNNKVLVASAEQGFLYQYLKGFLPKGRFQAITPCFRFEDFDELHTKYFVKNELIITDEVNLRTLYSTIAYARIFFQQYFKCELETVKTGEHSYDIMYNGDELGSYGIRSCSFLTWVYGTAVAEPRLSSVLKKYELSS
jgi:hypothetical protein